MCQQFVLLTQLFIGNMTKQSRTKLVSLCYMFDKVSQNILCAAKTNIDNEFLHPVLVLHQASDRNSQHCKFLTFFVLARKCSVILT